MVSDRSLRDSVNCTDLPSVNFAQAVFADADIHFAALDMHGEIRRWVRFCRLQRV